MEKHVGEITLESMQGECAINHTRTMKNPWNKLYINHVKRIFQDLYTNGKTTTIYLIVDLFIHSFILTIIFLLNGQITMKQETMVVNYALSPPMHIGPIICATTRDLFTLVWIDFNVFALHMGRNIPYHSAILVLTK